MTTTELAEVIFLGVVQGIAEFLPISSSGHLVLIRQLVGLTVAVGDDSAAGLRLNVALHCGTLMSILAVYHNDIWRLRKDQALWVAIVCATFPVAVVGLLFKQTLESTFENPLVASCGLMVTAVMLLVCQRVERGTVDMSRFAVPAALVVGLFQSLAIVPGISRSGSTITGGLVMGLNREDAARFSFLIAIPAIGGAATLYAWDLFAQGGLGSLNALLPMMVGTATSFVVGWLALRWLLAFLARGRLQWFAAYCFGVGALSALWEWLA